MSTWGHYLCRRPAFAHIPLQEFGEMLIISTLNSIERCVGRQFCEWEFKNGIDSSLFPSACEYEGKNLCISNLEIVGYILATNTCIYAMFMKHSSTVTVSIYKMWVALYSLVAMYNPATNVFPSVCIHCVRWVMCIRPLFVFFRGPTKQTLLKHSSGTTNAIYGIYNQGFCARIFSQRLVTVHGPKLPKISDASVGKHKQKHTVEHTRPVIVGIRVQSLLPLALHYPNSIQVSW